MVNKQNDNTLELLADEKYTIADKESGSRAFMPIHIDTGYAVEIIKLDDGQMPCGRDNERICDYLLTCKGRNPSIVCVTELKGTKKDEKVSDAYEQLLQTVKRQCSVFVHKASYAMAAIAGAQDKSLPRGNNGERRALCKELLKLSEEKVKNMDNLVFYVQPDVKVKKAYVNYNRSPRVIMCHSKTGAQIPVPSMLIEAVKK